MKTPLLALLAVLATSFGACGLASSHYLTYNFEKDKVMVATMGAEMINSTETYKDDVYGTVLETFESSFMYSGKQGKLIKILYNEGSDNLAHPSFTQELGYDITDNPIITFRHVKIRVLDATNTAITFIVLDAPAFKYKNGAKIE